MRKTPILLALVVGLDAPSGATGPGRAEKERSSPDRSWDRAVEQIDDQRRAAFDKLKRAQKRLRRRARRADEIELLDRLWLQPKARAYGYAMLPKITADAEQKDLPPKRTRYALADVESWCNSLKKDLDAFTERVELKTSTELAPLVADFESLRERHTTVQEHVDYHRFWQQAVIDHPEFFAVNNETVAKIEDWQAEVQHNGESDETNRRQVDIVNDIAPLSRTPGLELASRDGHLVLTVPVHSDITDEEFLRRFEELVERIYSDSPAAGERRFVLDVELEKVPPSALYPEGPPRRGEPIDLDDHLARFPADALVLTTGAERTHAWVGRYVQLGPEDSSPRSLAHEFGHLLGFVDAYIRGFEGDTEGPDGVVLVEWTGLRNDIMGAPDQGRVTGAMIDQLVNAYRPRGRPAS